MEAKILKTEVEYDAALAEVSRLMDAAAGTPESDTLELWSVLVAEYEARHHPIPPPNPVAAIQFRLDQAQLTIADLAPLLGGETRAVQILSGEAELHLDEARLLHTQLGIPAEAQLRQPPRIE